jgi:hypothetical protein
VAPRRPARSSATRRPASPRPRGSPPTSRGTGRPLSRTGTPLLGPGRPCWAGPPLRARPAHSIHITRVCSRSAPPGAPLLILTPHPPGPGEQASRDDHSLARLACTLGHACCSLPPMTLDKQFAASSRTSPPVAPAPCQLATHPPPPSCRVPAAGRPPPGGPVRSIQEGACCLCLCLGLRLVGSEQHRTGSDKGVTAGRPPPGGPVRSTGKNTRSSRVTSALWAFVLYGKNAILQDVQLSVRIVRVVRTHRFKSSRAASSLAFCC